MAFASSIEIGISRPAESEGDLQDHGAARDLGEGLAGTMRDAPRLYEAVAWPRRQ